VKYFWKSFWNPWISARIIWR